MSEERDRSASRIQELQEQITELKKAAGLHHRYDALDDDDLNNVLKSGI